MSRTFLSGTEPYAYLAIEDGTNIHPEAIAREPGLVVVQTLSPEGDFSVGGFPSAQMTVAVATDALPTDLPGKEIVARMGFLTDPESSASYSTTKVGSFYTTADKMVTKGLYTTITAYDAAYYATGIYGGTVTLPSTVGSVVSDVARQAGITISTYAYDALPASASSTPVRVDLSGLTYREVIARCAMLMGANASMNRNNCLVFRVPGTESERTFTADEYVYSAYELQSDAAFKVGKVRVEYTHTTEGENAEEVTDIFTYTASGAGSENTLVIQTDDITTQTETNTLGAALIGTNGFTYYGYNLKTGGRPELELGDVITLVDDKNVSRQFYIMSHTLKYDGSMSSTYAANLPATDEIIVDGLRRATLSNQVKGVTASLAQTSAAVGSFQAQIDGKIQSYSQSTDPSTAWTTTALKEAHKGDIWYNTTSKVTKRWSGTAWVEMKSSEAEAASELASKKAQIFTATPTTPYYVGDLWVTAFDGTGVAKVCKTSRASGSYAASDWAEGLKYTDDTAVTDLQVGGRNLISNAMVTYFSATTHGLTYTAINGIKSAIHIAGTTDTTHTSKSVLGLFNLKVKKGVPYTVSVLGLPDTVNWSFSVSKADGGWKWESAKDSSVSKTITFAVGEDVDVFRYINFNYNSGVKFDNDVYFQIEEGNKPTDWTPAPEDVQANITAITDNIYTPNTTTIDGGKITTGSITADQINANSLKAALITADNINALALNSTKGTIGGFDITSSAIKTKGVAVTSNADNSIGLSSADFTRTINGTSRSGLRFAIGDKFGVTGDGVIYAKDANIAGAITATSLTVGPSATVTGLFDKFDIGGRNLITNANASWVSGTYEGLTYTAIDGIRSSIHIAGTTTNANSEKSIIGFVGSTRLLVEKNVPYSITVEGLPSNSRWRVSITGSDDKWHSATPWTAEKSITKTFTGTEYCFRYINMDYPSGVVFNNDVYLKIEKGSKPTNWSPAPEDVQSQINVIKKHVVIGTNNIEIVGDDNKAYASYGETSTIGKVSKSHLQLDDNSVDLMVGNNRVGTFSSEGYVKTTISSWKTSTSTTKTFTVPTNKVESLISVTDANGRVFSNIGKLKDPDDPMAVDDSVMIIDHTGSSTPTLPITIEYMKKGAPAMLDVKGNVSVGGGVKGIFKIWVEESTTETYSSGTVKPIRFFLDELDEAEKYTVVGVTSVTVYHGGSTVSTGSALVVKDFGEVITTAEEARPHVRIRVINTGSTSQSGYVRATILGIKQEL